MLELTGRWRDGAIFVEFLLSTKTADSQSQRWNKLEEARAFFYVVLTPLPPYQSTLPYISHSLPSLSVGSKANEANGGEGGVGGGPKQDYKIKRGPLGISFKVKYSLEEVKTRRKKYMNPPQVPPLLPFPLPPSHPPPAAQGINYTFRNFVRRVTGIYVTLTIMQKSKRTKN